MINTGKRKRPFHMKNGKKTFHQQVYDLFNNDMPHKPESKPESVRPTICTTMTIQEHMWMQIAIMHICANDLDGQLYSSRRFNRLPPSTKSTTIWNYAPFICPDVIKKSEK
jgi:hypothetical protein